MTLCDQEEEKYYAARKKTRKCVFTEEGMEGIVIREKGMDYVIRERESALR